MQFSQIQCTMSHRAAYEGSNTSVKINICSTREQWRSQDFGLGGANVSTALYDLVI